MPQDGRHVVVACAEGDDHSLPARMVAAYLTYVGWRVIFLGATLPADDLGAYLADEQPAVLLLSCSSTANLVGARACVRVSHDAGVPVVVGGRAFGAGPGRAQAIGADVWINDPTALDELAGEGWDVVAAETQALPAGEVSALSEAVPALVEAAIASGPLEVSLASARDDLPPEVVLRRTRLGRGDHALHRKCIARHRSLRHIRTGLGRPAALVAVPVPHCRSSGERGHRA
jgi:methylmalonyl-CoA mutase cobalamin-binding subunit